MLGTIVTEHCDPFSLFEFGRYYHYYTAFERKVKEAEKKIILMADPKLIKKATEQFNQQNKWSKIEFLKSEEFEDDIHYVYLDRSYSENLNDIFRLGSYYALEMQKKNSGEAPDIL